ncbi:hypothetical protein H0H92_002685 [Tricholoma furcatifolium]|nr:hypothetical protein H0H92_002685 [Tricholoma furcatifolium]
MDAHQNDTERACAETTATTPKVVKAKKRFPAFQLAILFLLKLTEPINSTVIYPFVNQQESIFFFAECMSVYHWGRLSDKIGRRPVLLLGPFGLALAMTSFGLSRNFWMLVLSRCAQGIFNGNVGVAKSMMVEITDPADVPIAFGWLPAMWSTGITLGLPSAIQRQKRLEVERAKRLMLQRNELRPDAPLLHSQHPVNEYGTRQESTISHGLDSDDETNSSRSADAPPPFMSLLSRDLIIALVNHGFYCFLDQSHTVLLPLMLSTSIPHGGLGFDSFTIGMIMGTWGVSNAVFQVLAFGRIVKWLGPRKAYIFSFIAYPLMSILAKSTGHVNTPCEQLFILDAAPGNAALGAVNGLSQMMSSVVRTLAPTIASSLFSISQEWDLVGGYFVYVVIIGIVLVGWSMSLLLPPTLRGQLKKA